MLYKAVWVYQVKAEVTWYISLGTCREMEVGRTQALTAFDGQQGSCMLEAIVTRFVLRYRYVFASAWLTHMATIIEYR